MTWCMIPFDLLTYLLLRLQRRGRDEVHGEGADVGGEEGGDRLELDRGEGSVDKLLRVEHVVPRRPPLRLDLPHLHEW